MITFTVSATAQIYRCVVTLVPPGVAAKVYETYQTRSVFDWQTRVDYPAWGAWTTGTWSWTWQCQPYAQFGLIQTQSGELEVVP